MAQELPKGYLEELQKAFDRLDNRLESSRKGVTLRAGSTPPQVLKLEPIVLRAVGELRKELGKVWLRNSSFGSRLHAKVRKAMESANWPPGWKVFAERPLREFASLPASRLNQTVDAYLTEQGDLNRLGTVLPVKVRNARIGNIEPDLVIVAPDMSLIVWDLTSRERPEHVAKTMLYAILLTPDNCLTRIGETYWIPPEKWGRSGDGSPGSPGPASRTTR